MQAVFEAAARLQELVPDAVLVGGTAAAHHAGHRVSLDDAHVVADLRRRCDEILADLEATQGWITARVQRPVLILGRLDGVETGVRNLIRRRPLEVEQPQSRGRGTRSTRRTANGRSMIHRHCEVPPDLPAEELPLVAIADLLERGDLQDWQPLARAIRRDPWGELAAAVTRLIDAYPRYGTIIPRQSRQPRGSLVPGFWTRAAVMGRFPQMAKTLALPPHCGLLRILRYHEGTTRAVPTDGTANQRCP